MAKGRNTNAVTVRLPDAKWMNCIRGQKTGYRVYGGNPALLTGKVRSAVDLVVASGLRTDPLPY